MSRNVFTSEERCAELLCSRSTAFLEELVAISRNPVWPQNIVDSFFLVTTEYQRLQDSYAEQFEGFSGENSSQYLRPSQQHNSGKGRPKFLIPRAQLVGLRTFIKFYLEGNFPNAWDVRENRFVLPV